MTRRTPRRFELGEPYVTHCRTRAADLFDVVVDRAEGRCECTGQCGRRHQDAPRVSAARRSSAPRRCGNGRVNGRRLVAAPADPAVPAYAAARVPFEQLAAWCGGCLDDARRAAARPAAPAEPLDGLFDPAPYQRPGGMAGGVR
jgi:hypothetical protein